MKRKHISFILTVLLIVGMLPLSAVAATTAPTTATPTSSTVLVDNRSLTFDAYNISDNNFFKLRDLAYIFSGTDKQFEVEWNGTDNAINLTSGKPYTAVGGEMKGKDAGTKTPTPTSSNIYLDGKAVLFTAYTIEGNNYFKLRDIGEAFDFGVDWDRATNAIIIDTSKGYSGETNAAFIPSSQNQILLHLSDMYTEAYKPHYEGLHYKMSSYNEAIDNGKLTATFLWTMYHLGNGLDVPSDLGTEQEANLYLQVSVQIKTDGQLDMASATILADNSVTGPPTYQVPIEEYFPTK